MTETSERPGHDRLLDALVLDLQPVRPASVWRRAAGTWFIFATLLISVAVLRTGPLRPGIASELRDLRLILELVLGGGAAFAFIAAALEVGVPGAASRLRLSAPGFLLLGAWLGLVFLVPELGAPAASMIGKREHCFIQGVLISLLTIPMALAMLRRRALFARWTSGLLVGLAATALTGVWMQIACMYDADHALCFHFSPMLVAGALAAFASARLIPDP